MTSTIIIGLCAFAALLFAIRKFILGDLPTAGITVVIVLAFLGVRYLPWAG